MLALALLLTAAPPPKHFEPVRDFETQNKMGKYEWFGDRYALVEDLDRIGDVNAITKTLTCTTLDTQDLSLHKLSFELAAWAEAHKALFFDGVATLPHPRAPGRYLSRVDFAEIVHGDAETFWFVFRNNDGKLTNDAKSRVFLVRSSDGAVLLLGETSAQVSLRPITSGGGKIYVQRFDKRGERDDLTVIAIDPEAMEQKKLVTFTGTRGTGHWAVSEDFSRWAFADYSEKSEGVIDPPAHVHIFTGGEPFAVLAPVTPYGSVWSLDGTTLFIGSNELGTIQRIDVAKKEVTEVAKKQGRIQGFFLTPNGKTLLVMTRGANLARFSLSPFKPLKALSINSFLAKPKYSWDWSAFSPNRKRALLSKNKLSETVDYLDSEAMGVRLFNVGDE